MGWKIWIGILTFKVAARDGHCLLPRPILKKGIEIDKQRPNAETPVRGYPLMQDLVLMLTPVSLVTYFLVYPDQFHVFLGWFGHLIR